MSSYRMTGFKQGEIDNIKTFMHLDYPEWFSYKNEKGVEYLISTLDDCALRYRIQDEEHDKLLFFSRGTQVCYSNGTLSYNRNDVIRTYDDKGFE